jgi:diacylglycerol O-acyltransferase / wax synthase
MSVATVTELWRMSATELAWAIRSRQASSREVVEAHLRRIVAVNPSVNAVTVVLGEQALEAAKAADRAVAGGGDLPPFHGVPFTVKGNIDLVGTPTTQGLKALAGAGDRPSLPRGPVPGGRRGAGGPGRDHHADRSKVAVRTMRSPIDRLTALDQLMLRASERWPQDIGALALLDGTNLLEPGGRFRIEAVREAIGSRLHLVPRFRQVVQAPRRGLGGPLWAAAASFDLGEHIRVLPLPAGTGEAELLLAIERLRRERLDPSRPLWQLWFLTGLPGNRIALFVKLHHAIADGMAAMATVAALLDTVPDAPTAAAQPWTPTRPPSAGALLADNLLRHARTLAVAFSTLARPRATVRRLRAAWPATRELLAEEPATETSLDRMVGPDRNLALIRATLDAVKQTAHAHDATANDVLLAVTAGGLRALLRSRGEPVEDTTVRIYVPVSLRHRPRGPQQGNLIAQMAVPLPLGEADPGRRLDQIAAETAKRKARARTSLGTLFRGRIARGLLLKAAMRQRVNLASASIPGPAVPLYLAGARVLEVFPVLPLIANEPLGVGALSYAGTFSIGVVADRDAFPDLDVFAAGVREELRALGAMKGESRDNHEDPRRVPVRRGRRARPPAAADARRTLG